MKQAHYFKGSKKALAVLVISNGPRPVGIEYAVSGKVAARKLAKELNASPYNF